MGVTVSFLTLTSEFVSPFIGFVPVEVADDIVVDEFDVGVEETIPITALTAGDALDIGVDSVVASTFIGCCCCACSAFRSSLCCMSAAEAASAVLKGPADNVVIATSGFGGGNSGTCGGDVNGVVMLVWVTDCSICCCGDD